jgi:hypothetical protein
VSDQVEAALLDAVVVCHNSKFDPGLLDSEYRRLGREIQFPNLIEGRCAQADALSTRGIFFGMMDALRDLNKPLDDTIGILTHLPPDEGVQLMTTGRGHQQQQEFLFIYRQDGDRTGATADSSRPGGLRLSAGPCTCGRQIPPGPERRGWRLARSPPAIHQQTVQKNLSPYTAH